MSAPFNVADLNPYYVDAKELPCLKTKSFQEGALMEIKASRIAQSLRRLPWCVLVQ